MKCLNRLQPARLSAVGFERIGRFKVSFPDSLDG